MPKVFNLQSPRTPWRLFFQREPGPVTIIAFPVIKKPYKPNFSDIPKKHPKKYPLLLSEPKIKTALARQKKEDRSGLSDPMRSSS